MERTTTHAAAGNSLAVPTANTASGNPFTIQSHPIEMPPITLPKGGGAIKGIDEKFEVNMVTGTCSFSLPLPLSPSRQGFVPSLGLGYNSGAGNGPFGLGWQLSNASIARSTEKKLPQYLDEDESDTFVLSGEEDLVPLLEKQQDGSWKRYVRSRIINGQTFNVTRYRPRIERSFMRIEKWYNAGNGETHWRTITKDNIHSYYGLTQESRLSHPGDSNKVFEWMLCRVHDDKGSVTVYDYKREDFAGISSKVNEKHRIANCTQLYLKQVSYGNKKPYYRGDALPDDFMFKVIFDYGEHDASDNIPKDIDRETKPWACRNDPFSTYRSGFEIRTYRRCARVLVFHCFDVNELPHSPYLVKSLQLFYGDNAQVPGSHASAGGFSFLTKARQNGHMWDADARVYKTKHLPEIEIDYQFHEWNTEVKNVSPENYIQSPAALSDRRHLWIDLFSEGIAGILTETAGSWFYKSNLGNGDFSRAKPVGPKPSFSGIQTGRVSIQELEGNGMKYLVQMDREPKGYFRMTEDEAWEPLRNFETFPTITTLDPNMRLMDLNGDGIADLVFTNDDEFRWYAGKGEKGFGVSQSVRKSIDEEEGPAILFADREQSIFLADMSGDGLTDIVRVRNGNVCYWPNLGYGRFGPKVNMDNPPVFDHPDAFNPSFIRLADIDGSGTTDVIYLGKNDFRVWINCSGNEWTAEPQVISAFPAIDNLSYVSVLDFLGSGTASIVYCSPLRDRPFQYIDLMGGKKPHVCVGYRNNCGKVVALEYKASTHYYLEDKKSGNNWITKLPFPVHCISKVRMEDKVRETVFISSYKYRHGYFDHEDREFRGFARVESFDTEDFSHFRVNDAKNVVEESLHQPPVKRISWFHTGAYLQDRKIIHQCESEYFKNESFQEYDIPDALIGHGLSVAELREAYRACKGLALRSEVYAADESSRTLFPYSATQSTVEVRLVQPRTTSSYASFLVIPSESISYGYDRNPGDPRILQSFVLESDDLGNVTKSCSVVYPRVARPISPQPVPDRLWTEQSKMHISYKEIFYTRNEILEDDIYRLRAGYESKAYEINGIAQPVNFFFRKGELSIQIANTTGILFEEEFDGTPQKRLSAHSRGYFYKDDLSAPLALGVLSNLGIPEKSYVLAFTRNLVTKHYDNRVTPQMLTDAGYVHSEGDEHWWSQSGELIFPANPKNSFYTPVGNRDVFGNESFVEFDQHTLLIRKTTDALSNSVIATNDYRTLSPVLITDANMNRTAVETDALGMVIKTAVMGKEGAGEGDTLLEPTSKMEYDLFNWTNNGKPNYVHVHARERHGLANTGWQETYVYSDGGGSIVMAKTATEPGDARQWNEIEKVVEEVHASPRWLGTGRTILNNKGKPVKQYEPYFSTTFEYEREDDLVETGMTSILYYDPLGRNIKTEFPNGTFTKAEFDTWYAKSFDVNDTVKDSKWFAERGSPDPLGAEPADSEGRAAWLAAQHYNTPGISFLDSLGRTTYAITDHGGGKMTSVFSETDWAGRFSRIYDQLGRKVAEGFVNLLGVTIYGHTSEKGAKRVFLDVMGRVVRIWDNNARELYLTFDKLHRPVSTFVQEGVNETLFSHVVYGDLFPDAVAKAKNLKGRAYQIFDQAGVTKTTNIDFKGNPTGVERRLTKEYKQRVNWDMLNGLTDIAAIETASEALLDGEKFTFSTELDALGRPITATLSDHSVILPGYNKANVLDSLKVKIRGTGDFVTFLESQDYDAKGQRQYAKYGNHTLTKYFYDPRTFHLINLLTKQTEGDGDDQSIQNLKYTFDPVGNIVQVRDDAQQTHFFRNAVVSPERRFAYDASYQLVSATGREHAGHVADAQRNDIDLPFISQLPHENDATAVRSYTERYAYDECGNILRMQHIASGGNWTRRYKYEYEDDPANATNRLKATSLPGDNEGTHSASYAHDAYGNMTSMPHLSAPDSLTWDFMGQLKQVNLAGGGMAYYVYGAGGGRVRKVIERPGGKKLERIYLGSVEIYRERRNDQQPDLERYTLHISDNVGRIAQVDTKTIDKDNHDEGSALNAHVIRYQYHNYLGSSSLEADENGNVISYEEYHPYGTSAYRLSKPNGNISLKRYRFSSKERDDETGLYYFGARYYAAWLGRWTSCDPAGFVDGPNSFHYCRNNPCVFNDAFGLQSTLVDFYAPPQPISYSEKKEKVIEYFNDRTIVGVGTIRDDETGETHTVNMSIRVTARDAVRAVDEQGVGFWQLSEYTIHPGSGQILPSSDNPPGDESSANAPSDGAQEEEISSREDPVQTSTDDSGMVAVADSSRAVVQEIARPTGVNGARPQGTLHLWSGESGKAEAKTAIRRSGSGWMMGDIKGQPTPQHAAGEAEFARARSEAPGGKLTQAEFERIWGPRSASVVGRGAFAGHPVEGHGNPSPKSIQVRYEHPARAVGGGLGGALFFGTGMYTAITGGQDPNPAVSIPLVLAGVGEATSGIIYGSGAILGSAELMTIGATGATAFGGAAAAVGFGVASYRSFKKGDRVGGWMNALGAVGGVLLIASLFTPVGWVGLLGVGLVGLAAGFNLGRWFSQ